MRKGTVILLPCSKENWDKLIYKAKQILAEGECDCDCSNCPVAYVCIDPDITPYTQIKDFLKHNEYMYYSTDNTLSIVPTHLEKQYIQEYLLFETLDSTTKINHDSLKFFLTQ